MSGAGMSRQWARPRPGWPRSGPTLLKLERVSRHDNFFELGGHSLLAMTMIERMRREGLRADVRMLFTAPTLQALAEAVDSGGGRRSARGRNAAQPHPAGLPGHHPRDAAADKADAARDR